MAKPTTKFGQLLRYYRTHYANPEGSPIPTRVLTLREAYDLTGVHFTQIHGLEEGGAQYVKMFRNLVMLCAGLKIPWEEIEKAMEQSSRDLAKEEAAAGRLPRRWEEKP